jgi:alpha-glucosidase
MALTALKWLQYMLFLAPLAVEAQSSAAAGASPTTSFRPIFTVPTSATLGQTLLPNIQDPEAVDAQTVCPGYRGSNVKYSDTGLTADLTLAGKACGVYGTDIESLTLTVEYQTDSRLHVEIVPSSVDSSNESYYILSPDYVAKPSQESGTASSSDLTFSWSNDPSFFFEITRNKTGDVIFSTKGSHLVFENQFLEFVTTEPSNYHWYGLGEVIHSLDLGNNLTRTLYGADVGDPIDRNLYSSHPFALETRWYEDNGSKSKDESKKASHTSYSHGIYFRNTHGQEILLRENNVTWRTIGGSIDLYFFSGPSQPEVTRQYQKVIGNPAMQQYFTLGVFSDLNLLNCPNCKSGFHQCRWGYENWTGQFSIISPGLPVLTDLVVVEDVVNNYEKFGIPLDSIWSDIGMKRKDGFLLEATNGRGRLHEPVQRF